MSTQIDIASEFPLDQDLIYLNHAAVAPWPARTARAINIFTDENLRRGAKNYPRWVKVESLLRQQLRQLINAPNVEDIALLKNTSEALSVIAYGIDWKHGDNIVVAKQEFPSNRVVWQSLKKFGVDVRLVDIATCEDPEAVFVQATDKNTRLLSVSSVQYATGLRMDLHRIGQHCSKHDIYFCVDAIQSLGALQFNVQEIDADFVVADGHKWMLGPEGVALFYCRASQREALRLHQYGWHMLQDMGNYDAIEWSPVETARRFECGSPNMLGIHALGASLSLLLEIGMATVEKRILERSQYLIGLIQQQPQLTLLSRNETARLSGMVSFAHRNMASPQLYENLMKKNVICANRGGGIRFSPHFYTELEKIQSAIHLAC